MKKDTSVNIIDLDNILNPEPITETTEIITESVNNTVTEQSVVNVDWDEIVTEWFYRLPKGYAEQPYSESELSVLNQVLLEYGYDSNSNMLHEASFTPSELNRDKYLGPFIDRILAGEPFTLESDKTKRVIINKSFAKTLQQIAAETDSDARLALIKTTFKKPIIPLSDKSIIKLSDISKDTFTAKQTSSGLTGTETPDFKEGLVVFFYNCPEKLLNVVYNLFTIKII